MLKKKKETYIKISDDFNELVRFKLKKRRAH